jgi:hypothetical protein
MLKMEIEPTMCMKTRGSMTKCPAENTAFHRKTQQLRGNRQESVGLYGSNASGCAVIRCEVVAFLSVDHERR